MVIKVKASAEEKIMPDYMRINITLIKHARDKEDAMTGVLKLYNEVEKYFKDKGISSSFSSSSYTVSKDYDIKKIEVVKDGVKTYREDKYFLGYNCTQHIFLEIPIDVTLVIDAIDKLVKGNDKEQILINAGYFLKDKALFQDNIIKSALNRARQKAIVIAEASGISEEKVNLSVVDYTYNEYNSNSRFIGSLESSVRKSSLAEDIGRTIKPQEITLSESVYTEWVC